jgi:ribonuclease D
VLHAGKPAAKSHKLEDCCQRELDEEVNKAEQTSDWSGTVTDSLIHYAASDAEVVCRLDATLTTRLADAGFRAYARSKYGVELTEAQARQ